MSFKDHFSGHAAVYRDARPRYPEALYDWLAAQCATHDFVWDAGCGNGQASVALAQRFAAVLATDPSAPQIESAIADPRVSYRVEPAERCSAADASADLVTVAQALHWFDFAAFFAEARRVLKPRGVFAAWSYGLMFIAPEIDPLIYHLYEPVLGPYWPPERRHVEQGYRSIEIPFEEIAAPAFEMQHSWNLDQVLAYLASWSALQRYRKAMDSDPLEDLRTDLLAQWGDPATLREVRWPLVLRVART